MNMLLNADNHDEYEIVCENDRIYEIRDGFFKRPVDLSTKTSVMAALRYLHAVKPHEFVCKKFKEKSLVRYFRVIRGRKTNLFTYRINS